MDFSKVPFLCCKAIAMPSILGSINNPISATIRSKNSSIEFFFSEGNKIDLLLLN